MLKHAFNLLSSKTKHSAIEKQSIISYKAADSHEIQLQQPAHNSDEQISQIIISKPQQKSVHSEYRADIDGLRTIAISIVVIFHAFPLFMPGGFVGVDVFFVISGYLISGIIIKQANKNKFSIVDFYERRVKRIYPALIFVLVSSLIFAHRVYSYKQLKIVANTMAASTIFSANLQIMFHKQDYFDASQKENAFLHLWSLGVEEQFYIVWPCLIAFLLARFRSITTVSLGIFTLGSFALGIFAVNDYPKVAFYFPFCRFWQMSIGGLIAYKSFDIKNQIFNHMLSIFGTLAILVVIWIVNESSHFPGWWALVPTLSSACILVAGPEAFINKNLLSTKIFVFIGKISYPLYLWHWPLIVFSRKLFPEGSTSIFGNMFFILCLSVLLSIFTYFCVENKIRFRQGKKVVIILLFILLVAGLYAKKLIVDQDGRPAITTQEISPELPIYETDTDYVKMLKAFQKGLIPTEDDFVVKNGRKHPNSSKNPKREPTSVEKLKAPQEYFELFQDVPPRKLILEKKMDKTSKYYQDYVPEDIEIFQVSNEGQQNQVFIVGDSHARFLSARFQQLYVESQKRNETDKFPTIVSLCHSAHAYLQKSASLAKTSQMYRQFTAFFQRYFKQYKPKRILSMNRWLGYWKDCFPGCPPGYEPYSPQHFVVIKSQIDQFTGFMKELVDVGIEVTVATLHMDDDRLDPNKMYDASGVIEERIKPVSYKQFRQKYTEVISYFESSLTKVGVKLIDIADNFCWQERCEVLTPSGYPAYLDYNHFGLVYSRYWASSVDHLVDF